MRHCFWDLETTDLDTRLGQVVQVAAVFCDDNYRVLDSFDLRCRPLPWCPPHPEALRVTGRTLAELEAEQLSHYEMMTLAVARFRAWGPCVNTGFNTIPFDLPFWQHQCYQTLHPPYGRQVGGHVHQDALKMLRLASVLAPDEIRVATLDGAPTFRLGPSARANGIDFPEETAHDAHADLMATLALVRLIRQRVPLAYQAISFLAVKRNVVDFARSCPAMSLLEWKEGVPRALPVAFLGQNPGNMSEIALFDLSQDPEVYLDSDVDGLATALEDEARPIRTVKANKIPMLQPTAALPSHLTAHDADEAGLDRRAQRVASHPTFRVRLREALARRLAARPLGSEVEHQLYGRFISDGDAAICHRFHQARWADRHGITVGLGDARLRELAERLVLEHAPESLPDDDFMRISVTIAALTARRRAAQDETIEEDRMPAIAEPETSSFRTLHRTR